MVAGEQNWRDAQLLDSRHRRRRAFAHRVCQRHESCGEAVHCHVYHGAPFVFVGARHAGDEASHAALSHELGIPCQYAPTVHRGFDAAAWHHGEVVRFRQRSRRTCGRRIRVCVSHAFVRQLRACWLLECALRAFRF